MAMSDTEMALMMGANQLAAMRPVNPGAFSGIEAGMMPPGMMQGQMPTPAMPPAAAIPPGMMQGEAPAPPIPDFQNEESMMRYIQEKARQIRERMGGGAMSDADMGALDAVMKSMPATQAPPSRPEGSGSMSDMDMQRMMARGAT